jgi:hypothetical protein
MSDIINLPDTGCRMACQMSISEILLISIARRDDATKTLQDASASMTDEGFMEAFEAMTIAEDVIEGAVRVFFDERDFEIART